MEWKPVEEKGKSRSKMLKSLMRTKVKKWARKVWEQVG